MIHPEARWIAEALRDIVDEELFPLLNVGSQSAQFRTRTQPWIEREVFAPLERRGAVIHLDLEGGPGVDIAGDLLDPGVIAEVKRRGVRSVMCANVLEHVPDAARFAGVLGELVAPGAYLLATVPHEFPYHPDPIDTMFRPRPDELAALFPRFERRREAIVRGTLIGYLLRRLIESPRDFFRSLRGGSGAQQGGFASWLFRPISVTCVVFRKPGA